MRTRFAFFLLITLWAFPALSDPATPAENRPNFVNDGKGGVTIDPTKNVEALVAAGLKAQDDLRAAVKELFQAKLEADDKVAILRQEVLTTKIEKLDSEARLSREYLEKLAIAEKQRIDAIRAVDVNAVTVASQRTSEGVAALATQTAQSAEVLRNQGTQSAEALRALVASTAAAAATTQQQLVGALSARITTLEQAQS